MEIAWEKAKGKSLYYYGKTTTPFSAQIGESSDEEGFIWVIFHQDFRYCIYGESVKSIEQAKIDAEKWINDNYKIPSQ